MPRANLTPIAVEKLKPPKIGQIEYYDRRLPGFGLRVSYHGSKSWFVMTRINGKLVRLTLGKYPALSLANAREHARSATRVISVGQDPRALRAEVEERRKRERLNTFAACAEDFLDKHAARRLRPSTQREYRRILTGPDTAPWRARPITEIAKRDVIEVIEAMDRRGSPGAAKRALVYLRKFFNWCADREVIAHPPTARVPRPHPEVRRDRVLSEEELRFVLRALDADSGIFSPLVRILLLTGQRRGEVAGMRWSELRRLKDNDATWEIPGSRTKNKQTHLVPLPVPVRETLLTVPRVDELVFSTTGKTAVSGFGRAKQRLDEGITALRQADGLRPMPHWTFHDLRRTMVTLMNERLGIAPHVVEAVVNHMSGSAKAGVAGVYNRALYMDDRRRALDAWAIFIMSLQKTQRGRH